MGNVDDSAACSIPFSIWCEVADYRITRYRRSSNTLLLVGHLDLFRSSLEQPPSFSHSRSVRRRRRKFHASIWMSRPHDLLDDYHLALPATGASFGRLRKITLIAIRLNFID